MPTRYELIEQRRQELLKLGYKPGIVNKAMEWAEGCAEGMANYALNPNARKPSKAELVVQLLPQYLNDCENWIRSFGHAPGDVKPQG